MEASKTHSQIKRWQQIFYLLILCATFFTGGYFFGYKTAFKSPLCLVNPAETTINPYQDLNDNATQITELFSDLAKAENPELVLADIKERLDDQATQLESQTVSDPMQLVFMTHLNAYQALYEKKLITLQNNGDFASLRPPKLIIVEDRLTSEFNYHLDSFSIENWLKR